MQEVKKTVYAKLCQILKLQRIRLIYYVKVKNLSMNLRNSLSKKHYLLLSLLLVGVGTGTAYAGVSLPTITLGGNVVITGDLTCTDCVDESDILQIGSQTTVGKDTTGGAGDCLIGEIRLFSNNLIPRGFLSAEGQILQINDYFTLFTLIGTKFGGDGQSTFQLPDLRNVEPTHRTFEGSEVDLNYAICAVGVFPSSD